eukprot:TRINITY_DN4594_c0_g1_i1.p1 TRINITY_DN4594_c0_g1~~TRINITY_DN4594_c0_g1_i1.p1  ORF type:complete len:552 (+),score=147.01 TRINITY_DN4594_c0_g1_i1:1060-2715(+)
MGDLRALELDLKQAEHKVDELLQSLEDVKKQFQEEEDKRKSADVGSAQFLEAQDRGLQLISHRKQLEQELDRAKQEKTGARTALRMATEQQDEENKREQDAIKDLALAKELSSQMESEVQAEKARRQEEDEKGAQVAAKLAVEVKENNHGPPGYEDDHEDDDVGQKRVSDAEAGEGDPEIAPVSPLNKKKKAIEVRPSPKLAIVHQADDQDDKYEEANQVMFNPVDKFKDKKDKKESYGYEDPTFDLLPGKKSVSVAGPGGAAVRPARSKTVSEPVKNRTLLETLDQGGQQASRELVGTPYCEVCKNYLSSVLATNWRDPHSAVVTGFLKKKKGALQLVRQSRWFILAQGHLVYYIMPEDFGVTFPNGVLHLDGCIVHDKDPHGTDFTIERGRKKKMNLKAENVNEKRMWISAIRASDEAHAHATESHQVSDLGHFCVECNRYLNMDDFTLAEMDGFLMKFQRKKNQFAKKWTVYSRGHIAYFDNLHDVSLYQPHKIIHLEKGAVSPAIESEFTFTVKSLEREFTFKADSKETYQDWLDVLGAVTSKTIEL